MRESAMILNKFNILMESLQDSSIAIYGLGGHTEYILEHLEDKSKIVGLMDGKRIGEIVYGMQVYDTADIVRKANVVVVIARIAVEHLIYERIKSLIKSGVVVYNVNGEDLSNKYAVNENAFDSNAYWNISIDSLKAEIVKHDVISFDIFDTLLMRRIIRPHEELGFEEEKKLLTTRSDIVECFYFSIEQGKEIFILSDMYFSSSQLGELLALNGVQGYKEIIVSCEHNATKEFGDLYEVVKQKARDSSILHIGDNILADIENAKIHGVDAFYVMSAYDMLLNSPMYKLLQNVPQPSDSRLIGQWAAITLNSPFALSENKGRITINDMYTVAAYFAPMVNSFMCWFVKELERCGEETLVLFLARDGYLIKILFDWLKDEMGLALPKGIYFPTSRSAVSKSYEMYAKNYIEYSKRLGIYDYEKVIVYDFVTKGTTVSRLSEILGIPLELICFASFNIEEKFHKTLTHSFLGDYSFYELPYFFLKTYELLEIMSAPNKPQFLYFDDVLNLVYDIPEMGKQWTKIAKFQEAIQEQFRQFIISEGDNWRCIGICRQTADNILSLLESSFAVPGNDVKDAFMFDSSYEGVELSQWWDKIIN